MMRFQALLPRFLLSTAGCFGFSGAMQAQAPLSYNIQRAGLTGAAWTGVGGAQSSSSDFQNSSNQVSGYSLRGGISNNGQNTWVYVPSTGTTVLTGLTAAIHTGSDGFQYSANNFQNAAGQVAGFSRRSPGIIANIGQNTWNYNPANGIVTQTGFTSANHTGSTGYQFSVNNFQSPTGQVAGYSQRVTGVSTENGQNTWAYNPATGTTVPIGFTTAAHTGSAGYQYSVNNFQNDANQVAGSSMRIMLASTSNGQNTWVYNPTSGVTVQTGLTSAAFTSTGGYQYSVNEFQSATGRVAGRSQRVVSNGADNGQNTWVYNPTLGTTVQTGFATAAHTGSGGYQYSANNFQNSTGQVAGYSIRYSGIITVNGQDTWIYNPTTGSTLRTGLTTSAQTGSGGYQFSVNSFQNAAGQVAGYSNRITGVNTSNGANTWSYNPVSGTTTQTGLTTSAHTTTGGFQYSFNNILSTGGHIAGNSRRYIGASTENGQNTWAYNPTSGATVQTGLATASHTGSGGYQSSLNDLQNAAGITAGYSERITGVSTNNGQNTWAYNPASGTSTQTGITSSTYTGSGGYQYSANNSQSATGQVAGYSMRVTSVTTSNGQNTWVYSPTNGTTVLTGLTTSAHTGSGGYQRSLNNLHNSNGIVVGFSERIRNINSTNGQDAWYYDPTANATYRVTANVPGAIRTSDNYSNSNINILTESGYALGSYTYFTGGAGGGQSRAFLYRPDIGFYELSSLVNGGLSANGWAVLTSVQTASINMDLVGYGLMIGQSNGSQAVYVLTAVPEPAALGLVAALGLFALRRRLA